MDLVEIGLGPAAFTGRGLQNTPSARRLHTKQRAGGKFAHLQSPGVVDVKVRLEGSGDGFVREGENSASVSPKAFFASLLNITCTGEAVSPLKNKVGPSIHVCPRDGGMVLCPRPTAQAV